MRTSILVATHKPDKVYADSIYTPIHVGRAISNYKKEMAGMIGDDTGENISEKNPSYCELTATYWAWKNLLDVDFIGLCHYRRYFETQFTEEIVHNIMREYDVVLPIPYLNDHYLETKLARILTMEDEIILLKTINKLYPEYERDVIHYLYDFVDIPYNMFLMSKSTFSGYASFLFNILEECEKLMKPLPYSNSARRLGYIGEFLLPIYCLHNRLNIKYENIVPWVGTKSSYKTSVKANIKIKLLKLLNNKNIPTNFEQMFNQSVLNGLKGDIGLL